MRTTESVNASGQKLIEWGGHDAWKTRRLGDLLVSLEWAVLPESRTAQRVAVIGRPREGRLIQVSDNTQGNWHPRCYREKDRPYMLEFDKDGKPTGRPTRDLIWDAGQSIQLLGYGPNDRAATHHYIDALLNAMIDMVRMPSAPPKVRRRLVGGDRTTMEVTAVRDGKTTEVAL